MAGKKIGSLLSKALTELEQEQRRIEEQIQALRGLLNKQTGSRGRPHTAVNNSRGPGRMSAAARKRIADAQKRRWAEYRKSAAAGQGE
jgi:hypothetical protein